MNLTFGQKLLVAFGVLLLLVMAAFTVTSDLRLRHTTETYVEAMIDESVAQSTSSIAEWLNSKLATTEAAASALQPVVDDAQARNILAAFTRAGLCRGAGRRWLETGGLVPQSQPPPGVTVTGGARS